MLTWLLAATLLVVAPLGTGVAHAAEDDLTVDATTTFIAHPTTELLEVRQDFTLTNTKPPVVDDNRTEDFFFTSFAFAMLANGVDLEAFVVGEGDDLTPMSSERQPVENGSRVDIVTVELPDRLGYEESIEVSVSYLVPTGEARTDDPVRVTDSYIAFPVYACCDSGRATVRVEIPVGYDVDLQGANTAFDRSVSEGSTVLEQRDIEDPAFFNAYVFGQDTSELTTSSIVVEDNEVEISARAEDEEWVEFVSEALQLYVPELERLLGQDWPVGDGLRIVQTVTPNLFGYGGWFHHHVDVIEVGEALDESVLVHEVSHAWLSDDLFNSRWINEGLAEYWSSIAIRNIRGVQPGIAPADRSSFFAMPLNDWSRPIGLPTNIEAQREGYGYAASTLVIRTIASQIGEANLARVVDAVRAGEISYRAGAGSTGIEIDPDGWASWQRFMDLVQQIGGWDGVDGLFRRWVAGPEDLDAMDRRAEALVEYDAFVDRAGGWSPPVGVRRALTVWDFDTARSLMADADAIRPVTDEIAATAAALDLPVLRSVRQGWQASLTAEDLATTTDLAERQLAALTRVQAITDAVAAPRTWDENLGVGARDLEQRVIDMRNAYVADDHATLYAVADEIEQVLTAAPESGRRSALLLVIIAVAALALLALWWTGRRRDPDPVAIVVPDDRDPGHGDPADRAGVDDAAPATVPSRTMSR